MTLFQGAVVGMLVLASIAGGVGSERAAAAEFACRSDLALNVAGHQDDDLLFMAPSIQQDVTSGRCTLTVFATAGDDGRGAAYWHGRETGSLAAYAHMAGVPDQWTAETESVAGHPLLMDVLDGRPSVALMFLRLPDGGPRGGGYQSRGYQSLEKLWNGTIARVTAVNGSATYTKSTLSSTFTALMNKYQPAIVRAHDYVGRFGDGDHSDHHASAYFALQGSRGYVTLHRMAAYQGDPISSRTANLTTAQRDAKLATFLVYAAHDPLVCQTAAACLANRSYAPWFSREYQTGSEVGGQQNIARVATVTESSQNTSTGQQAAKAVDGVVAGNPNGTTHEWATVHGRVGSWIDIAWGTPHTLVRVVLYDRPNPVDRVTGGTLRFSDGTTLATGALPNDGTARILDFSPRRVTGLRFTVTGVTSATLNVGLAELQAYTDDVAPRAQVAASSQSTTTNQQAVKAVDGVVAGNPTGTTREWATVHGGAGSWLQLDWPGPQTVDRVVLYDRPNLVDQITGGTLTFSDGSTLTVPALPNNGSGQVISFPAKTLTRLRFTVTSVKSTTLNVGLAEIEVESPQPLHYGG